MLHAIAISGGVVLELVGVGVLVSCFSARTRAPQRNGLVLAIAAMVMAGIVTAAALIRPVSVGVAFATYVGIGMAVAGVLGVTVKWYQRSGVTLVQLRSDFRAGK